MSDRYTAARPKISSASEFDPEIYRKIFQLSTEPMAIISSDGRYLEQNNAHRALLGYSDEELRGQTPALHMGQAGFEHFINELTRTGAYKGEAVSNTKKGEIKHIEIAAFTTREESGDPICYVGIKRNVTERKIVEEGLKRSEAELSDFFENATIGMHWISADGTLLRVNQAELDVLGYSRDEYEGKNIADFHVDQSSVNDILNRLKAGEVLSDYEARLRCKDGS